MIRSARIIWLAAALALLLPAIALGAWQASGNGKGYSKARSLSAGETPTATVSNRSVTVSWSAPSGGAPPSGYQVKRYNNGGAEQTIAANCSGTITGTSCTENQVPGGTWRYSVTPVRQNWTGTESAQSAPVTVNSPTLTLSGGNINDLPATRDGSIANFIDGQTVSFRLDDPTTGTALTGSITPSPVPANGSATVSVTIPSGTSSGDHNVYAIGSQGDVASTTVYVAASTTFTSTTWELADASPGFEYNLADYFAFDDSWRYSTKNFSSSFSSFRYQEYDYNGPLPSGASTAGVDFVLRFADQSSTSTSCFYFDVRRQSTGAVVSTHGSSASPVGCVSGTTQTTFTTALPAVTTSAIANDLRVRVYFESSESRGENIDRAVVSGTSSPGPSFTLYETSYTDRADTSASVYPHPLVTSDSSTYRSITNWSTSFSASRYLLIKFPAYVPSGATVTGASFKQEYRSDSAGTTCVYFEVLAGSTVIGTHGSAGSPLSCSSSTTTYTTDDIALPEATTVAQANDLRIKLYVRNSSGKRSAHDLVHLTVTYAE